MLPSHGLSSFPLHFPLRMERIYREGQLVHESAGGFSQFHDEMMVRLDLALDGQIRRHPSVMNWLCVNRGWFLSMTILSTFTQMPDPSQVADSSDKYN